jgi:hypothetical protein
MIKQNIFVVIAMVEHFVYMIHINALVENVEEVVKYVNTININKIVDYVILIIFAYIIEEKLLVKNVEIYIVYIINAKIIVLIAEVVKFVNIK